MDGSEDTNQLTGAIIGAAIKVHTLLGPGLVEHAYTRCLRHEIECAGLRVESEVMTDLKYKELVIPAAYRIDLLVENTVVVEVKAVQKLVAVHHSQMVTYLKVSGKRVGLLINFHVPSLREGLKRFVNQLL